MRDSSMHKNHNVAFNVVLSMLSVIVIFRNTFLKILIIVNNSFGSIIELLNKEIKKYKEGFSF